MKRWLVFVVLLITVVGAVVPGRGQDGCAAGQTAPASHNNEDNEEGRCSPFFSCTACAGFVDLIKPIQLMHPSSSPQTHHERAASPSLSAYVTTLFQPPRR